jgi:hypothetical protein
MQAYSNPKRQQDPYSLPDVEIFWVVKGEWGYTPDGDRCDMTSPCSRCRDGCTPCAEGYYWWYCFPGCLPDSEPHGAFPTEELALADMRENAGADDFGEDDPEG